MWTSSCGSSSSTVILHLLALRVGQLPDAADGLAAAQLDHLGGGLGRCGRRRPAPRSAPARWSSRPTRTTPRRPIPEGRRTGRRPRPRRRRGLPMRPVLEFIRSSLLRPLCRGSSTDSKARVPGRRARRGLSSRSAGLRPPSLIDGSSIVSRLPRKTKATTIAIPSRIPSARSPIARSHAPDPRVRLRSCWRLARRRRAGASWRGRRTRRPRRRRPRRSRRASAPPRSAGATRRRGPRRWPRGPGSTRFRRRRRCRSARPGPRAWSSRSRAGRSRSRRGARARPR